MPKLENFATHIKINGNLFLKNSINYQIQNNDSVGLYYTNQSDQRILKGTSGRFDDWTDLNDVPYSSFDSLILDLDSFLVPNIPLEVTPQNSITLGSLIIPLSDLDNVRRMSSNLDGTSTNDFTTFQTKTGEYKVPELTVYTVAVTSFATNSKFSISLGYADDSTGTNYVELIDESIMSPENNYSNETEFIFIIPAEKFPIINNKSNITTGFVILQGLQNEITSVATVQLNDLPELSLGVNIDKQRATNALLQLLLVGESGDTAIVLDEATMLNGGVAEILALSDNERIHFSVTVRGKNAFIRLYPAATDNLIKGTLIKKDQTFTIGKKYTGEISIIAEKSADKPDYFVTTINIIV